MDKENEEKTMHYVSSIKDEEGRVTGYNTGTNLPEPTDEEARALLRDRGVSLSEDNLNKFKKAHNSRMTKTLTPTPYNPIFAYPFVVKSKENTVEFEDMRRHFYTVAASIPGKARHGNFTISVIGRMPTKWMELWIKGTLYFLGTRIAPKSTKELTRTPIPKPGKPNKSRSLSLVHDCFSFVVSYAFKDLVNTLEESGVLSDDINAYRPGFSAEEIPNTIIFKMQEARETGEMIVIVAKDEEQYFDCATPEIQHLAMKGVGMPDSGWIELKNETMIDRACKLITNLGIIDLIYKNGLPQGRVSSVIVCNLCARLKLKQWIEDNVDHHLQYRKGYRFATTDHLDQAAARAINLHTKTTVTTQH